MSFDVFQHIQGVYFIHIRFQTDEVFGDEVIPKCFKDTTDHAIETVSRQNKKIK